MSHCHKISPIDRDSRGVGCGRGVRARAPPTPSPHVRHGHMGKGSRPRAKEAREVARQRVGRVRRERKASATAGWAEVQARGRLLPQREVAGAVADSLRTVPPQAEMPPASGGRESGPAAHENTARERFAASVPPAEHPRVTEDPRRVRRVLTAPRHHRAQTGVLGCYLSPGRRETVQSEQREVATCARDRDATAARDAGRAAPLVRRLLSRYGGGNVGTRSCRVGRRGHEMWANGVVALANNHDEGGGVRCADLQPRGAASWLRPSRSAALFPTRLEASARGGCRRAPVWGAGGNEVLRGNICVNVLREQKCSSRERPS